MYVSDIVLNTENKNTKENPLLLKNVQSVIDREKCEQMITVKESDCSYRTQPGQTVVETVAGSELSVYKCEGFVFFYFVLFLCFCLVFA